MASDSELILFAHLYSSILRAISSSQGKVFIWVKRCSLTMRAA
ncbi:MAG: hypothetical protein U1A78_33880 [Polyangia bacterium]